MVPEWSTSAVSLSKIKGRRLIYQSGACCLRHEKITDRKPALPSRALAINNTSTQQCETPPPVTRYLHDWCASWERVDAKNRLVTQLDPQRTSFLFVENVILVSWLLHGWLKMTQAAHKRANCVFFFVFVFAVVLFLKCWTRQERWHCTVFVPFHLTRYDLAIISSPNM